MATAATRLRSATKPRLVKDVRLGRILTTVLVAIGLQLVAWRLPLASFAGADLADPTQRLYATNIWQETQTSLVLLLIFLPWLLHALIWKGSRWGAALLAGVALAGTAGGLWLTLLSLQSYRALPQSVTGTVARLEGRQVWLRDRAQGIYLVVSDSQLAGARVWLKAGAGISLWVSPRGHAGYLAPAEPAS